MPPFIDTVQAAISHEDLMLPVQGTLFSASGWVFELKYAGVRCLAHKRSGIVRLESRSGRDMSTLFPEVVRELERMPHDFVLDAELVVLDAEDRPQCAHLRDRSVLRHTHRIKNAALDHPASLFAFDLLELDGADMRARPLLERKAALQEILRLSGTLRYAGHVAGSSSGVWKLALYLGHAGIIAKEAGSVYTAGRSSAWRRIDNDAAALQDNMRGSF